MRQDAIALNLQQAYEKPLVLQIISSTFTNSACQKRVLTAFQSLQTDALLTVCLPKTVEAWPWVSATQWLINTRA